MSKVIGIDLGTTNSAVAVFEGNEVKIIPNQEGKNTTPSIVAFTEKGEILVGEPAKRQAITNPENTIDSIKRIMGLMYNEEKTNSAKEKTSYKIVDKDGLAAIQIQDKVYTPQEISAKILSKLKRDAESFLGETVTDAVITVPAYFNDAQRKATQEAGVIAGLNVLRVINEPTSASLAYGLDKEKEENILVFDFGGGTMDVSLLEIGDGTFEVLATDGNAFLGGKDIDNRIAKFITDEFKASEGIDLSADKMAMQRIMDGAENAKKELSATNETNINLPFVTADATGPKHLNMSLTRAKFESLITDLVDETIEHIDTVLKDAELSANDVQEIVMVGGSTRIPMVEEKVSKYFSGKKVNKSVNPDEVVAAGASIQGAVIKGDVKDVLLLDVTPLSLGIETMGNIMTTMIEKGTTIPVSKKEVFSTAEDNQPAVNINIAQGEAKLFSQNKILGSFNLEGIAPAPRGVPQIEISLDIDANGVLTVSAIDKATGKEQNITITGSSGLSEEEINDMIQKAEKENAQNAEKIEAIKKRNELDSLSNTIKTTAQKENLDLSQINGMEQLLNQAEELVKNQSEDKAEIERVINELTNIAGQMQQMPKNNNAENQNSQNEEVIDAEIE